MKLLAAISFPLLVLPLDALAGSCPVVPAQITKAIRQHIITLQASEYCAGRTVKTENGITVAIYTAEGACAGENPRAKPGTCSNNWARYMVALSGRRITPPVEVGGKGDLADRDVKISDGTIEVSGLSIGPNDSMCCPSVPGKKTFKISPSGLSEIRP
ncbi:hypothetical protein [Ralstonia solanacearum]|uniref:hypothetical protein n=1 Tax=Ralstonia solanacearum TaxID=305 RepID=UPI0011C48B83|nr:hypothetical protein [Ralstonia solanacearum]QOK84805.1 hypothetical protein HF906_22620 [Ralstonia solanacearum]